MRGTMDDGSLIDCRAFNAVLVITQAFESFGGTFSGLRLNCSKDGSALQGFGPFDGIIFDGVIDESSELIFRFDIFNWFHAGRANPDRHQGSGTLKVQVEDEVLQLVGDWNANKVSP